MTRLERQKEKAEKEKALLEYLLSLNFLTSELKAKFRSTSAWINFRKKCYEKSKGLDAVTLRKLPKRWENHHKDLNPSPSHYCNMDIKKFSCLSNQSHECIHYLYEVYRKDKNVLKRLKKILDDMVYINDGMSINDYKKLIKKEKEI